MKKIIHQTVSGLLLILALLLNPVFADDIEVKMPEVELRLITENNGIKLGENFLLGIEITHVGKWHTYWKNPGDTGIGTTVSVILPKGFTAGAVQYATPKKLESAGLTSLVNEGVAIHLVEIATPLTSEQKQITIEADVNWMACDDQGCLAPKTSRISKNLMIRDQNTKLEPTKEALAIQKASNELPLTAPDSIFYVEGEGDKILIEGDLPEGVIENAEEIEFIPDVPVIDLSKPITKELEGGTLTIEGTKGYAAPDPLPETIGALIKSPNGSTLYAGSPQIAPVKAKQPQKLSEKNQITPASSLGLKMTPEAESALQEIIKPGIIPLSGKIEAKKEKGLGIMLVFAFIGGMILNLMPCVFPVLGIKIMGFVKQAGDDKAEIRKHGLFYGLGVILSLWLLVAIMLILKRSLGQDVLWGFQFQNPYFLLGMIALLFIFGLSLSGVFEFGTSMTGVGGKLTQKQGITGSFFSGLLVILLSTPCSGPFMAQAIGFAFQQPAILTFAIFTSLALGLAFPYVLLSFLPSLVQKLPKPGAWMETFKQFMAFPLYGTAVWLAISYGKLTGIDGLAKLLIGLVFAALGLWLWGRFGHMLRKKPTRILAGTSCLGLLGLFLWFGAQGAKLRPPKSGLTVKKHGIEWQVLASSTLPDIIQHRNKGKTVFLDFTAFW